MKKFIPGPLPENARNLMRRVGYGEHVGHEQQLSYVKRLSNMTYPRWHAYVEDRNDGMQINLHLDQKQASYASGPAHGGEYEGPLVEREMTRIMDSVARTKNTPPPTTTKPAQKKKLNQQITLVKKKTTQVLGGFASEL